MANVSNTERVAPKDDLVIEHIAEYIIQVLIKEDVNAFTESPLLLQLLTYKLKDVAVPMMYNTIVVVKKDLVENKKLDVKSRVGGITGVRRIFFRNDDQYKAFVSLFFRTAEEHPGLVESIDDEQSFENFMIYCVNEFKEHWDRFVEEIARERLALEYKNQLYAIRSNKAEALQELPSYADYVAERIDAMASAGPC